MGARPQFSLRMMLAVIAAVSLAAAAILPEPSKTSGFFMLVCLAIAPGVCVIGIISGRGFVRAFSIGVAGPAAVGLFCLGRILGGSDSFPRVLVNGIENLQHMAPSIRETVAILLGLMACGGLAGVFAQCCFARKPPLN